MLSLSRMRCLGCWPKGVAVPATLHFSPEREPDTYASGGRPIRPKIMSIQWRR
jgi:hypothetical protein